MVMKRLQADFDSDLDMSSLNERMKDEPINTGESLDELLNSKKFNPKQKTQAKQGLRKGLTEEQILFYFRPEFSSEQMEQAKWGFEDGMTEEQLSIFYKPEFDIIYMATFRQCFTKFKPEYIENKVNFLLNLKTEDSERLRIVFNSQGLRSTTDDDILFVYDDEFSNAQLSQGLCGFQDNLTREQISAYYKPEYSASLMSQCRSFLRKGGSIENLEDLLEESNYSSQKMEDIVEFNKTNITKFDFDSHFENQTY